MTETSAELNVIYKHLQQLRDKKDIILGIEKSFSPVKPLDRHQRKALSSKSSVVDQYVFLNELVDEISTLGQLPFSADDDALRVINKRLRRLTIQLYFICRLRECLRKGKPIETMEWGIVHSRPTVMHQFSILKLLFDEISSLHRYRWTYPPRTSKPSGLLDILTLVQQELVSAAHINTRPSVVLRSRMKTKKTGPRYLCIFDGLKICCLDLEQREDQFICNSGDVPLIPRIATLDLLKERLPVSVGLFKDGSDVYMIGGQEISASGKKLRAFPPKEWNKGDLYPLGSTYGVKGTSCFTYRLFLKDGALSHHRDCSFKDLRTPKTWPIVEKIDGLIHVIDSIPPRLCGHRRNWSFSHEVLNPDGEWEIMETTTSDDCIVSHLVVGDRIYAETADWFLVFDGNERKWEAHKKCEMQNPHHVCHILSVGFGRCVGVFPQGDRSSSSPLYVVIAVMQHSLDNFNGEWAVAYLVTSTGRILCMQPLRNIFEGPLQPCDLRHGTVFNVDEEGKTMCAVAAGSVWDSGGCCLLFINTFTVEMLTGSALQVRKLWEKAIDGRLVELEFVRVHLKDTYIFRSDDQLEGEVDFRRLVRLSACFL